MIICDKHKFVFIHIPKCAGTTVRSKIEQFNSLAGPYSNLKTHEYLGKIDYGHIPLFIVEKYFPEQFKKLVEYKSFAVIRNPFDRFPSSLSTHLRMYGQTTIQNISEKDLRKKINEVINYLSKNNKKQSFLSHKYIHFQKQIDFIFLEKAKVVKNIYTVSEINTLLKDLSRLTGEDLLRSKLENKGVSKVYRNIFFKILMEDIRPKVESLYKPQLPKRLKSILINNFFVPRDNKFGSIFDSKYVNDFLKDFYADDIRLFEEINGKKISN